MAIVRVRQHVNPLGIRYREPIEVPQWSRLYADVTQPFHLDIGSARGQFLLGMAQTHADWNFLGLEIREPLVHFANEQRDELTLQNLHFLFCNANASVDSLLQSLPMGSLQQVTIQFPDPWFKRRHRKRRVVQPELVEAIARHLIPEGRLFLQSDIQDVAIDMRDRFHSHPAFTHQGEIWYPENPFSVTTEREEMTLEKREPVYRTLFIRNRYCLEPSGTIAAQ